jgi:hypothetical protein
MFSSFAEAAMAKDAQLLPVSERVRSRLDRRAG